jgi:hypothetical protein
VQCTEGPGDQVSAVYCGSRRSREGTLGPGDPESELLFQETQEGSSGSRRPSKCSVLRVQETK